MFYTIKNDLDTKVSGYVYHEQAECLTPVQTQLITPWYLFDPKPNLRFQLVKRAKLTDVLHTLSMSNDGFLINEKVKNIVENHNIMRHQYFNAKVYDKNDKEYQYYWLHLSEPNLTKQLDYQKTQFYIAKWGFQREGEIALKNYEEYEHLKSQDKDASFSVRMDKIALSDKFDNSLDVFTFIPFADKIYISERLKTALENADVTGFEIKEATNFPES